MNHAVNWNELPLELCGITQQLSRVSHEETQSLNDDSEDDCRTLAGNAFQQYKYLKKNVD